jgi:GST-like protein
MACAPNQPPKNQQPGAKSMIDFYYWTTPNGHKVTMFLEEAGIAYSIKPINIGQGEQFAPAFLKIAPNNRIPALVDHAPEGGGSPIAIFESGAILLYLADKLRRFIPQDLRGRNACLQWLFWQMGGLGPMAGQNHHFVQYAPEQVPYAIARYVKETARLYGVLNKHLSDGRAYICQDYSIADMAAYPWIVPHARQRQNLDDFPALKKWFERVQQRPATQKAYDIAQSINQVHTLDEKAKAILFGQGANQNATAQGAQDAQTASGD